MISSIESLTNTFTCSFGCLIGGMGKGYSKNHLYSGLSHCDGVVPLSFADVDVVVNRLLLVTVSLSKSNIREGWAMINL